MHTVYSVITYCSLKLSLEYYTMNYIRPRMKVKSGHYNGPETCRTAFVIPDHIAILLL